MRNRVVTIEILYFDGCPSWKRAAREVRQALATSGIDAVIEFTKIESQEEAEFHRFVGSPTLRVNRKELFPGGQSQYGLGCRIFYTPQGMQGWPTQEMIAEKLVGLLPAD